MDLLLEVIMALVKVETTRTINNVRACQVEKRSQADLLIFVTDLRGISNSKEHLWTYVELAGEADLRIYWDQSGSRCLKICFVDDVALAGWENQNHELYQQLL